jgi:hypothetical protein
MYAFPGQQTPKQGVEGAVDRHHVTSRTAAVFLRLHVAAGNVSAARRCTTRERACGRRLRREGERARRRRWWAGQTVLWAFGLVGDRVVHGSIPGTFSRATHPHDHVIESGTSDSAVATQPGTVVNEQRIYPTIRTISSTQKPTSNINANVTDKRQHQHTDVNTNNNLNTDTKTRTHALSHTHTHTIRARNKKQLIMPVIASSPSVRVSQRKCAYHTEKLCWIAASTSGKVVARS